METKLFLLIEKIKLDIKQGQYDHALQTLEVNKDDLFLLNPLATLNIHINVLIETHAYTTALERLRYYKDKPYHSQAVEEEIRSLEAKVNRLIDKLSQPVNIDESVVINLLNSHNFLEVLKGLRLIKENHLNATDFVKQLRLALKKDFGRNIMFSVFANLINDFPHETFTVFHYGTLLAVKTQDLFVPLTNNSYLLLEKELEKFNKNTTIHTFAKELAERNALDNYPLVYEVEDVKALAVYFAYQASRALQDDLNATQFFGSRQISNESVKNIVKKYHLDMYQG